MFCCLRAPFRTVFCPHQRYFCLLHQRLIAVVQIMQHQIADRQDRQFRIIVPGNDSDAAIMIDRVLHGSKRIFSKLCRIGSIDFIRKFTIEFHFHPRTFSIPLVPSIPALPLYLTRHTVTFYIIPSRTVISSPARRWLCKNSCKQKASGLFQVTRYGIYFFVFYSKLFRYTPNTVFVSRMPAAVFMVCSIKDRIACWLYPLSDALTI